jgi:hypothetical protein|nr:hypothetical protein [Kofleriaceae bacterium]
MHSDPTTTLDSIAAALVLVSGGLSLAMFIGLTLFMSFGAISQKTNTVGLIVAVVLVLTTAVAGVIALVMPAGTTHDPGSGDYLAGTFAIAVAAASVLMIVGLTLVLAIPAIFGRRQLITSWPQQTEMMFMPHEQAASRTGGMAWAAGLGVAGIVFAVLAIVNLTVEPQSKDLTKDMNMSNVSKKKGVEAPAPAPTPSAPDSK